MIVRRHRHIKLFIHIQHLLHLQQQQQIKCCVRLSYFAETVRSSHRRYKVLLALPVHRINKDLTGWF